MNRLGVLIIITLFAYNVSASEEKPDDITRKYFKLLKHGKTEESIKYIYNKFSLPAHLKQSVSKKLPDSIAEAKQLGKLYSCDHISSRDISNRYIVKQFVCFHEHKPIRYVLEFYKPNNKWKVIGLSFDKDIDKIIEAGLLNDLRKGIKHK